MYKVSKLLHQKSKKLWHLQTKYLLSLFYFDCVFCFWCYVLDNIFFYFIDIIQYVCKIGLNIQRILLKN